jgi:hypothetical protein
MPVMMAMMVLLPVAMPVAAVSQRGGRCAKDCGCQYARYQFPFHDVLLIDDKAPLLYPLYLFCGMLRFDYAPIVIALMPSAPGVQHAFCNNLFRTQARQQSFTKIWNRYR